LGSESFRNTLGNTFRSITIGRNTPGGFDLTGQRTLSFHQAQTKVHLVDQVGLRELDRDASNPGYIDPIQLALERSRHKGPLESGQGGSFNELVVVAVVTILFLNEVQDLAVLKVEETLITLDEARQLLALAQAIVERALQSITNAE